MGMRDGLLNAPVRTQKSPKLLALSARSLPYFRIQAHTTRAAFATVTMAVLMPLPHHSGAPHSTQNPSHRPPDCPTTTAASLIIPAVVPGSHRRPTCNISLRVDRWRAPVVYLSLFSSSLLRIAFIDKNVRLASGQFPPAGRKACAMVVLVSEMRYRFGTSLPVQSFSIPVTSFLGQSA